MVTMTSDINHYEFFLKNSRNLLQTEKQIRVKRSILLKIRNRSDF